MMRSSIRALLPALAATTALLAPANAQAQRWQSDYGYGDAGRGDGGRSDAGRGDYGRGDYGYGDPRGGDRDPRGGYDTPPPPPPAYARGYDAPPPPPGWYHAQYGPRGDRPPPRRYRCDRGTGGTILGAIAGGLLGNGIAGRGDRGAGTIIGAGVGALAGRAIDRSC